MSTSPKIVVTGTPEAPGPNLVFGCASMQQGGAETPCDPEKPVALCACGKSSNMPYCSGAHKSK